MNRVIVATLGLIVWAAIGGAEARAGSSVVKADAGFSGLSGRWVADSGASLTIRVRGSSATIWGTDGGSSFVSRCRLLDVQGKHTASCSGDGYNLEDKSFDYASDIVFADNELSENWRAFFDEGDSVREISGEESFKRQAR